MEVIQNPPPHFISSFQPSDTTSNSSTTLTPCINQDSKISRSDTFSLTRQAGVVQKEALAPVHKTAATTYQVNKKVYTTFFHILF